MDRRVKDLEVKEKPLECDLCKGFIDEAKPFARFTHFTCKDKILGEKFYHVDCFRNRMADFGALRKMQEQTATLLNKAVGAFS